MTARASCGRGATAVVLCLAAACAPAVHPRAGAPDDSVSVGYGTQSKRDVNSAISSVSPTEAQASSATSLEDLIQGRVAGVEILRSGGIVSLRIRGSTSFNASTEPLYVIDGMKINASSFTEAMHGINPRDVARIDVLKDASATAIYGSEGANGVVLVTTRRAR